VRNALASLPCVEKDSVEINFDTKEARFNTKEGQTCSQQQIEEALANAGSYTLTSFKAPKSK
jgi:hypothetical protein